MICQHLSCVASKLPIPEAGRKEEKPTGHGRERESTLGITDISRDSGDPVSDPHHLQPGRHWRLRGVRLWGFTLHVCVTVLGAAK